MEAATFHGLMAAPAHDVECPGVETADPLSKWPADELRLAFSKVTH